ncbi:MAG: ATP-binding protein [Acidobacteriota bacterium]|nr:ATP-binding protein [Acidobacteriota bacterium]
MPHIFCLNQQGAVIFLFVWANAVIGAAYYVIPFTLLQIVRKRRDIVFDWMFLLFGAFILACGTTHWLEIWTLWHPMYRLQALVDALTAVISLATSILLIRLMPKILQIPSPELLRYEISERKAAESEIRVLNAALEERVRERTSALEQANRQLGFANAELRSMNEDLQQFAYAASHDLQEPLRMLSIYSQLVQRNYRGRLDERADEQLATIVDSAKRMGMLLTDLLSFSSLRKETSEPPSCVDPEQALDKALSNLARQIAVSEATITRQALPCVYASEAHLIQIFQNLISNAVKYRAPHPLQIEISATLRDSVCTIAIKDNGIGIDPAYRKQIFGVFKRLHGKGVPGTGIGLALCQKIMERYGGRIWVEPEINYGSTFYFEFPAERKVSELVVQ